MKFEPAISEAIAEGAEAPTDPAQTRDVDYDAIAEDVAKTYPKILARLAE